MPRKYEKNKTQRNISYISKQLNRTPLYLETSSTIVKLSLLTFSKKDQTSPKEQQKAF